MDMPISQRITFIQALCSLGTALFCLSGCRAFSISPRGTARRSRGVSSSIGSSEVSFQAQESFTVPPFVKSEPGYPSPLHQIHIGNILSEEEASTCYELSSKHARSTGRWEAPDFDRHRSYATCDFPVESCNELDHYLKGIEFDSRVWNALTNLYGIDPDDMEYLDLFVAHYNATASTESKRMDRLELHRDGSLLSFSVLLSSPGDFQGGGHVFDALRDEKPRNSLHAGGVVRPEARGDGCFHCGKLLHGVDVITSGTRTVLVGFVEVAAWCCRPAVLSSATMRFGREDVATFHAKQLEMGQRPKKGRLTRRGASKGWSHWVGPIPSRCKTSISRRADSKCQRQRKLEAEDRLLRDILLPRNGNME